MLLEPRECRRERPLALEPTRLVALSRPQDMPEPRCHLNLSRLACNSFAELLDDGRFERVRDANLSQAGHSASFGPDEKVVRAVEVRPATGEARPRDGHALDAREGARSCDPGVREGRHEGREGVAQPFKACGDRGEERRARGDGGLVVLVLLS